jgi:hypothetical protein
MPVPSFPRKWTRDELRLARDIAENRFVLERKGEGPSAFYAEWDRADRSVRLAMTATNDLTSVTGVALLTSPTELWQVLRYFCAPPISEEDLWTLVGKKFKSVPADMADKTAVALTSVIDIRRFPWFGKARGPTPAEREAALIATTLLLAHEAVKTVRRGRASKKQEDAVAEAMKAAGLSFDPERSPITVMDHLGRGHYSRERKVDGAKCDIPVRLYDGRLLALECKVSNGPKNSWKRLHREAGGKAERWKMEFGAQVITGAVLAGVYDLSCVVKAQDDQNVFIFWEHDLRSLADFVSSAK